MTFDRFLRIALALCLIAITIPAFADDAVADDALQVDAAQYAADFGVSLDDAIVRLRVQEAAGRLAQTFAETSPETYAGLWLDHSSERLTVNARFVGGEAALRRATKRSTGLDEAMVRALGRTRVKTAQFTVATLNESLVQTRYVLAELGFAGDLEVDVRQNRVALQVVDAGALRRALNVRRLSLPEGVEIVRVDALAEPVADVYGGLPSSTCTWGFSVQNGSGTKGVATAGHCGNSQAYNGSFLPFQSQCYQDSSDLQWHTDGSFVAQPKIRIGTSSTRDIYGTVSRNSQSIGAYVCGQGKTTLYRCGTISSKTYAPSYVPSVDPTFIRVANQGQALSIAGDSGGPWVSGNYAYGITSGRVGNDAIYTAINYLSCLGVSVLTTSPPVPTCEEECGYDYSECQVDFCYWDYDAYMCNQGCDDEYDRCVAGC